MSEKLKAESPKHVVIDARIRRTSTGRYTDGLINYLQQIDHDNKYTVLLEPDDPWQPRVANFSRADAPYKQFSFSPLEQLKFAWQLYRLKPSLVHFTMTQFPLLYFGNIIVTTHDLGMLTGARPKYSKLAFRLKLMGYKFLLWQAHKKAKKIIVPTDFVKREVTAYHPFTVKKLVRTYESSESQANIQPKKPTWLKSEKFILYQGTAFPHKNTARLVDAFKLLTEKYPDLHLDFNGKKEFYYEKLETYVKDHGNPDRIHINGFVADDESKWMFAHAQAYVTATEEEGFGLTGLEAMEQGTPVVCSDIPVLREVYGNAAHYFNQNDIEDIAIKISEVLDDEALSSKLKALGTTQAAKYSWQRMAEETLDVYKEVLSKT